MSSKNLLVITELFLPTKGGSAVWFDEVYRRLGGKSIHILTAEVPGAAEHDKTHANTIHRVNLQRIPFLRPESLAMYLKLLLKAIQICSFNKIHAIHAGRVLPEGLVAWLIAKFFSKPVVIYAHGEEITTWRQPAKFKVMSFVYRHADKVIANSEFTENELLKLNVKAENITRISPGVDIERFKPKLPTDDLKASIQLAQNESLILSVGRLSRRKGFDQIIKAIPQLRKQGCNVKYALIGIGEDGEYLEDLAQDLGVADFVHFLGHVSMEDLPRWYNACDIFAMPNREINGDTEGFGMVFLEAAACGKPVICGTAGGTGSAVLQGTTGLRVNGDSLENITEEVKALLTDNKLRTTLGYNALQRAQSSFSWNEVANLTESEILK